MTKIPATMTYLEPNIAEALRARHAEAKTAEFNAQRRLPRDLAEALIDTVVLRSWVARKYGGLQSHPLALYEFDESSYRNPTSRRLSRRAVCWTDGEPSTTTTVRTAARAI